MLPTVESLLHSCNQIRKAHATLLNERMKEEGLSPNEFSILIILSNNPHITTATQLCVLLDVSKGLVSRNVEHLCKRGILTCQSDENDRRVTHLRLSENAQGLLTRLKKESDAINRSVLADFSEEEIQQVSLMIQEITQRFQKEASK